MKKNFTNAILTCMGIFLSVSAFAQIPDNSPFPVVVEILAPADAVQEFDYGSMATTGPAWGTPSLSETVSGNLAWARGGVDNDSLACVPLTNNLTGKIALIRRGACGFSLKTYHAQQAGAIGVAICNHYTDPAQDGTTLVGMLAGDSAAAVTIPAVFLNRNTCEIITSYLDAGTDVELSFTVKTFYDAVASYSYHTPLSQAIPNDVMRINYVNPDPNADVTVDATAVVTSPSGTSETFTGSAIVGALGDSTIIIDGAYTPTENGEYEVVFSNSVNDETVTEKFVVTDYTWALDRGNIDGSIGPDSARFSTTFNFDYQVGALFLTGDNGGIMTHMSFGLGNAASVITGDPTADALDIILYDGDADNDGTIDITASFDDLTPIGATQYIITGNEPVNEMIVVEVESLAGGLNNLLPNHPYYTVIKYNGLDAGTGRAPRFSATSGVTYLGFPTSPIFLDQIYGAGWNGRTVAVRSHLQGFVTGTDDLELLDAKVLTLAPNPANQFVNLGLDFPEMTDKVEIFVSDYDGRLITTRVVNSVQKQNIQLDVTNYAAGNYFVTVKTANGLRTKHLVVVH